MIANLFSYIMGGALLCFFVLLVGFRGGRMSNNVYTTVGDFIISGEFLDNHTMSELEQHIWGELEQLQNTLNENYSCRDSPNSITQGDMEASKLRVRVVLESASKRFDIDYD